MTTIRPITHEHEHERSERSRPVSRRGVLGMALAGAGAALLAACGGSATATPISATAAGAGATPAASPAAATSGSPTATSGSAAAGTKQKVNANTASQAEVAQVLQANGVPNAARWAIEVVEYRPYPTNDPTFAKLRTNLAKYNPSPDVVDQIVASLSL